MFIRGIGVHVPAQIGIEWAVQRGLIPAEEAGRAQLIGALVAGDKPAPEMALSAAREAVGRAGQQPAELDLTLYSGTWHQGPEGWSPCSYLQRHLTGGDVPAMELVHGCSGMFGGMELAASYLRADQDRTSALLISADNYGDEIADRWAPGPFLPGDAATAVVLGKEPGFAQLLSVCSGIVLDELDLFRNGQPMFPPSATSGARVALWTRGRKNRRQRTPVEVAKLTERMNRMQRTYAKVTERALSEAGITVADITRVGVIHTIREVIEDRGMHQLGVDLSKSTWDYGRRVGHCGASDHILALEHLVSTGQLKPGDHYMMLGTGPGTVLACAIIKIIEAPSWAAAA
jgi:3-oxoacyl-[acyl-carrier-protein] synthase III